jgi:hypothetical protein
MYYKSKSIQTGVMAWAAKGLWVVAGRGKGCFSSLKSLDCIWDPPNLLLNMYGMLSVRIKQLRHYANHSPVQVEVENEWSCTSTSPYMFIACTGTPFFLPE